MDSYPFKTKKERRKVAIDSMAGLGIFLGTTTFLLNPLAVGAAALFAVGNIFRPEWLSFHRQNNEPELLPDDAPINKIVRETSEAFGMEEPPKVYLMDKNMLAEEIFPKGLRWLKKTKFGEKIIKQAMPSAFAAVLGTNKILTTKEGLEHFSDNDQMRFVAAHEIAHLKTDNHASESYSKLLIKKMFWPVVAATAVMAVAGLPLTLGVAGTLCVIGLARAASSIPLNFANRLTETRADRNALYATRDFHAAKEVMNKLYPPSQKAANPYFEPISNLAYSHPGFFTRVKSLRKSFYMVSQYPSPRPAETVPKPVPRGQTPSLERNKHPAVG